MLGSTSIVMVCVLVAAMAVNGAHGTDDVTATEVTGYSLNPTTIYLFPGTRTLTTLQIVEVTTTSYASCLATKPGLQPCSDLATARYYAATPLALNPTDALNERGIATGIPYSGDMMEDYSRGIPFNLPAVLPVRQEIVTFTSAIVTSTVTHPSVTVTIQIDGCNPSELPFTGEACPAPPAEDDNIVDDDIGVVNEDPDVADNFE